MEPFKITGAVTATALNPLHTVPGESFWNCRYRTDTGLEGYNRKILPLALAKHKKKNIIIKGVKKKQPVFYTPKPPSCFIMLFVSKK